MQVQKLIDLLTKEYKPTDQIAVIWYDEDWASESSCMEEFPVEVHKQVWKKICSKIEDSLAESEFIADYAYDQLSNEIDDLPDKYKSVDLTKEPKPDEA